MAVRGQEDAKLLNTPSAREFNGQYIIYWKLRYCALNRIVDVYICWICSECEWLSRRNKVKNAKQRVQFD